MFSGSRFDGSIPSVTRERPVDPRQMRLHIITKNGFSDTDGIDEYKADFTFMPNIDIVREMKFGVYHQQREKRRFQIFGLQCQFCGYGTPAPSGAFNLRPLRMGNYFNVPGNFYTYDHDAYVRFVAEQGFPIVPRLLDNRYKIEEEVTSLYIDFTLSYAIGDMPLSVNVGTRYAETDIDVGAVQRFISDLIPIARDFTFSWIRDLNTGYLRF